jgi:hypothetical protein
MTKEIFARMRPDYICFDYKSVDEYEEALQQIVDKKDNEYLCAASNQILVIGRIRKFIQMILGYLGFTDHTHFININSAAFKLLYHGEVQGFLSNEKILGLVAKVKDQLTASSERLYYDRLISAIEKIYDAHQNKEISPEKRKEDLIEAMTVYHDSSTVKEQLAPDILEYFFQKPVKNEDLVDFGDIHLKLAKRLTKKEKSSEALSQFIHAEKINNISPQFQVKLFDQFVQFLKTRNIQFEPEEWKDQARPLIMLLVRRTVLNDERFLDARDCLKAALQHAPVASQEHEMKLLYFEILYQLDQLHLESDFEDVFLKEIEACKTILQDQETEDLLFRIADLNYKLGKALSKVSPQNIETSLKAVQYLQEVAKKYFCNEELYELGFSLSESILLSASENQGKIVEKVLTMLQASYAVKPFDFIPELNTLIQNCEVNQCFAAAVELYEQALAKWPGMKISIQPDTYSQYAMQLPENSIKSMLYLSKAHQTSPNGTFPYGVYGLYAKLAANQNI